MGYGQGVADIVEWMGSLDPSKWATQYGWMDPDFLMTLMLENVTDPEVFSLFLVPCCFSCATGVLFRPRVH